MAATLSILSIVCFTLAGICLALAVFFFIFFKIPLVVGDLSGRNAQKSITRIREANEKSGRKHVNISKTNLERGIVTKTMAPLTAPQAAPQAENSMHTAVEAPTADLPQAAPDMSTETTVESSAQPQDFAAETAPLIDENATTFLNDENATTLLDTTQTPTAPRESKYPLDVTAEVILIHTDEVIE